MRFLQPFLACGCSTFHGQRQGSPAPYTTEEVAPPTVLGSRPSPKRCDVPAVPPTDSALATRDDIRRLEELIVALRKAMDRIVHDQEVQFKRIAQVQADIDLVRGAWTKLASARDERSPAKPTNYAGPERPLTARKK